MSQESDIPTEVLAETDQFIVWVSEEPDGEIVYHIDLGMATLHFFKEEFDEFVQLMQSIKKG
jgi:hypothetical protein